MAQKIISQTKLTDTLTITNLPNGFWLYDKTQGMNLSMRAKTEIDALVNAITYYQRRLKKVQDDYKKLNDATEIFISSITELND